MDELNVDVVTLENASQDKSVELHGKLMDTILSFASDHGLVVQARKIEDLPRNQIAIQYLVCDEETTEWYIQQLGDGVTKIIKTPEEG